MEEIKKDLEELKKHTETPMLFLIDYFQNVLATVDFAAENFMLNIGTDNENRETINKNRKLIIEIIQSYENDCYKSLKKRGENNSNENINLIEHKLKEFENNNSNKDLEENLKFLIDEQIFVLHSRLFLNKFMIFADISHEKCNSNSTCFGKLFVINNQYVSKKSVEYISETLNQETIKAWYLAKVIDNNFTNKSQDPIIEINTNDVQRLETIDLSNENFERIQSDCFKGFNNLKVINLEKNNLNEIEPNAFNGLFELTEINLYDNKLTSLNPEMFKGLKQLHFIDLVKNQINDVHPSTFHHLTKLVDINLSDNRINSLDSKLFNGLKFLSRINLSNNILDSIDSKLFYGLSNLIIVELVSNRLTSIQEDTFKGLTSLSSISLRNNNICGLKPSLFKGLESLVHIDLGFNNRLTNFRNKSRRKLNI